MNLHALVNLFAVSILLFASTPGRGQALPPWAAPSQTPAYAPGEVLVQFKANVTDQQIAGAFQQAGLVLIKHIQTPAMKDHGQIGVTRAATALPVPAAVRLLNNLPGVEFAEPNWIATQQAIPDDPLYTDGSLWGLYGDDLQDGVPSPIGPTGTTNPYGTQAEKAWEAGFLGSHDVYVGIIDGGIQYDHLDLAENIWTNPDEIPGNGIDDDGDGYVDDVHGWNTLDETGTTYTPGEGDHATHVAGTIGAVGGNGIGAVGVNWHVSLINGKCFAGPEPYSVIIEAIDYMTALKTRKGLNIVALNHSWSGAGFSQALLDSITRAAQAGILSVCAASNNTNNNDVVPYYPASLDTTASAGYDAVIAVAAIRRDGELSTYSNWGQTNVDLGAPGGDRADLSNPALHDPYYEIVSTVPTNSYGSLRGTSMATPHVTGAIALYASVHPGSTPRQIRSDLLSSGVRPLAALQGITVTGGTLDIGALMQVPGNSLPAPNAPVNVQAQAGSQGDVDLSWGDQSDNELGFAIERSTDGQTFVLTGTVGANLVNYSDRTVLSGATYFYRVRAYNPGGSSDYAYAPTAVTAPFVTPPAAPSGLSAVAFSGRKGQPGGVTLTWTDNANNENGFQVERKTGNTGAWEPLVTLGVNTTNYTDFTTVHRTKYTYRVHAYNIAGNSASSNEVSVTAK